MFVISYVYRRDGIILYSITDDSTLSVSAFDALDNVNKLVGSVGKYSTWYEASTD